MAALVLSAQVSAAQQPGPPQPPGRPTGMMGGPGMAQHMQMMDSLNARLDTLVSRMNQATGNRKVTAMADVINELVAQRKAMHEHMRRMMESRQGMMMRMMADSAPADTTGHAEHHPPN
ncbi:MAG TPA: hypothetical protein VFU46_12265 [Gemmatimonadales bacterium]|nr:hypothetical protein [Gemmatimonadales bacterium]